MVKEGKHWKQTNVPWEIKKVIWHIKKDKEKQP